MASKQDAERALAACRALAGLGASLPGFRAERPTAGQEADYSVLRAHVEEGCAILSRDSPEAFVNPCVFPDLFSFWSWVWASHDDGKTRKQAPVKLFTPLIERIAHVAKTAEDEATGDKVAYKQHATLSAQSRNVFAVLNVDLDKFKTLNDTRGHDEGDRCINIVVGVLESIGSGRGRVFRQGGDEFALVLRNCTQHEAQATGERLRATVERECQEFGVTASVGVAASDGLPGEDGPALMKQADLAMYAAKQAGGNLVR